MIKRSATIIIIVFVPSCLLGWLRVLGAPALFLLRTAHASNPHRPPTPAAGIRPSGTISISISDVRVAETHAHHRCIA